MWVGVGNYVVAFVGDYSSLFGIIVSLVLAIILVVGNCGPLALGNSFRVLGNTSGVLSFAFSVELGSIFGMLGIVIFEIGNCTRPLGIAGFWALCILLDVGWGSWLVLGEVGTNRTLR